VPARRRGDPKRGRDPNAFRPCGWGRRILEEFRRAEERFGRIGVAGVYGVGTDQRRHRNLVPAGALRWNADRLVERYGGYLRLVGTAE
jgi:hypothetical protein